MERKAGGQEATGQMSNPLKPNLSMKEAMTSPSKTDTPRRPTKRRIAAAKKYVREHEFEIRVQSEVATWPAWQRGEKSSASAKGFDESISGRLRFSEKIYTFAEAYAARVTADLRERIAALEQDKAALSTAYCNMAEEKQKLEQELARVTRLEASLRAAADEAEIWIQHGIKSGAVEWRTGLEVLVRKLRYWAEARAALSPAPQSTTAEEK